MDTDTATTESVLAEPVLPAAVAPVVSSTEPSSEHPFISLYDSAPTTIAAIVLGMVIVGSVQVGVARIFRLYREEHRALTAFATSMVALVVGIYVCDMLIAGPTAELLSDGERASILGFIKDTALMVFAYYFGTKAQVPRDEPRE
jgi:uncharacterized membrane protein YozB (DUF420 family)